MELCRGVGKEFQAGTPSANVNHTSQTTENLRDEIQRLKQENAEMVHKIRAGFKSYRREQQTLLRRSKQQKAVIMKYRDILRDFLRDSAFINTDEST